MIGWPRHTQPLDMKYSSILLSSYIMIVYLNINLMYHFYLCMFAKREIIGEWYFTIRKCIRFRTKETLRVKEIKEIKTSADWTSFFVKTLFETVQCKHCNRYLFIFWCLRLLLSGEYNVFKTICPWYMSVSTKRRTNILFIFTS
jgi:hypothetical protein